MRSFVWLHVVVVCLSMVRPSVSTLSPQCHATTTTLTEQLWGRRSRTLMATWAYASKVCQETYYGGELAGGLADTADGRNDAFRDQVKLYASWVANNETEAFSEAFPNRPLSIGNAQGWVGYYRNTSGDWVWTTARCGCDKPSGVYDIKLNNGFCGAVVTGTSSYFESEGKPYVGEVVQTHCDDSKHFICERTDLSVSCENLDLSLLSTEFVPTSALQLSYAHNKLTMVAEGVLQLTMLEELDLSDNLLVAIPNFYGLTSLQIISLERNLITEVFRDAFFLLTRLTTLNLANNVITSLYPSTFDRRHQFLFSLTYVNLTNNTIQCSFIPPVFLDPVTKAIPRPLTINNIAFAATTPFVCDNHTTSLFNTSTLRRCVVGVGDGDGDSVGDDGSDGVGDGVGNGGGDVDSSSGVSQWCGLSRNEINDVTQAYGEMFRLLGAWLKDDPCHFDRSVCLAMTNQYGTYHRALIAEAAHLTRIKSPTKSPTSSPTYTPIAVPTVAPVGLLRSSAPHSPIAGLVIGVVLGVIVLAATAIGVVVFTLRRPARQHRAQRLKVQTKMKAGAKDIFYTCFTNALYQVERLQKQTEQPQQQQQQQHQQHQPPPPQQQQQQQLEEHRPAREWCQQEFEKQFEKIQQRTTVSKLSEKHLIASGPFGCVYRTTLLSGKSHHQGMPVALKCAKAGDAVGNVRLLVEARLLLMLKHAAIIPIVAVRTQSLRPWIATSMMMHGDLQQFLRKVRNRKQQSLISPSQSQSQSMSSSSSSSSPPTSSSSVFMSVDPLVVTHNDYLACLVRIAGALEYLEGLGIVHADVAARNVLVGKTIRDVYLNDFGSSVPESDTALNIGDKYSAAGVAVPFRWMAPESLFESVFTSKSDVFAFGVVVWECCAFGKTPYGALGYHEVQQLLMAGKRLDFPSASPINRDGVEYLMQQCWDVNPLTRPSFKTIAQRLSQLVTTTITRDTSHTKPNTGDDDDDDGDDDDDENDSGYRKNSDAYLEVGKHKASANLTINVAYDDTAL